ncbi:MAG: 3-deoxy-manno-octulosonate cytidylyltransferase [Duncaniella sp.]|nr:3-deoxy-manno-octulosonate cytidylyltransferase [Duncaniella sp.]
MNIVGIIPARYGSSRFPGKPLADVNGMPMIERVYRQASKVLDTVIVATDDKRIYEKVVDFGGKAIMTSADCPNGTSRVYEAYILSGITADIVINIQGDEPYIHPEQIVAVAALLNDDSETQIGTLAHKFDPADGFDALFSPDRVKMTMDRNGRVLYFSRSIIPYVRNHKWQQWLESTTFHTHIGLYGFRPDTLRDIISLPTSPLEEAESLEQLKWLENGYHITAAITPHKSYPVDTPEDLNHINGLNLR